MNTEDLELSEEALNNAIKLSPFEGVLWGRYMLVSSKKIHDGKTTEFALKNIVKIYFKQELEDLMLLTEIGEILQKTEP